MKKLLFAIITLPYILKLSGPQLTLTPIPTPIPASSPSPDTTLAFYGTIVAAIIAALAVIFTVVYQVRKGHANAKELTAQQNKGEEAREHAQVAAELDRSHREEIQQARLKMREREQQLLTSTASQQNRTDADLFRVYHDALHADPDIAEMKILDMSHPLKIEHVYVRLRLHEETRSGYDVDPMFLTAQSQRDPNAFFLAGRRFLETRTSTAMTPEEALQKYQRCVVLGDPGAGKSTLLKYLTLKSINQHLPNLPCFPLHIVLGKFAASGLTDLIAFAALHWSEKYCIGEQEAYTFIHTHLATGDTLLLLDALDETGIGETSNIANDSYDQVLKAIIRVTTQYPQVRIVVTARKAGYLGHTRLIGFTELDVLDFGSEEIEQFITKWFASHPMTRRHATAADLISRLKDNPRIEALAANPLLLSLIVLVYEVQQDLPDRRADLYKECLDTLLFKWDTSRDIRRRRRFKSEHKRQLLIEIAWYFHRRGYRYFPEDELLAVIARFLPTIDLPVEQNRQILQEIEEENGLLKEQAHGWHGFLHLTLQEYCVALAIEQRKAWQELLTYCGDPWWEEVLSLYAGATPDASALISQLLASYKRQWLWRDIFSTHLLWAGQCLAARPRIIQSGLRFEVISYLITLLISTHYTLTQEQVRDLLKQIGSADVKKHLLALLADTQQDSKVRQVVAGAVGELGDKSVVGELMRLLTDPQQDNQVREVIAEAVGELGDKSMAGELMRLLTDTQQNSGVREVVAWAAAALGEQQVISDLLKLHLFGASYLSSQQITILANLINADKDIRICARLLKKRDIADEIHSALWTISRREKYNISLLDWKIIKSVRIRRWPTPL